MEHAEAKWNYRIYNTLHMDGGSNTTRDDKFSSVRCVYAVSLHSPHSCDIVVVFDRPQELGKRK